MPVLVAKSGALCPTCPVRISSTGLPSWTGSRGRIWRLEGIRVPRKQLLPFGGNLVAPEWSIDQPKPQELFAVLGRNDLAFCYFLKGSHVRSGQVVAIHADKDMAWPAGRKGLGDRDFKLYHYPSAKA